MAKNEKSKKKNIKEEVKNNKKNNIEKESVKSSKKNEEKVMKFIEFVDKYRLAIYGVVGGVLATLFVVILIWPDRIAKLKDGTEPVAEIDGLVVTADDLYEDMKKIYSISSLLDKIDNSILVEKYPELYMKAIEAKESGKCTNREDFIMLSLGACKVYRCGNTKWEKRYE